MANVSQLQPAFTPQVQTSSIEASEKDADFLALRLVNKRARIRLSPEPLDLAPFSGKGSLFAIVNSRGWFAAVTRDASGASALVLSPLTDLRTALAAASADDEQPFKPQRRVLISGTPHIVTFTCNGTRLLLGLVDGSIHVYSADQLLSSGEGPVQPIHVFTTSSSATLLSIRPNTGDIPELIAVLRDCTNNPGSLAVELLDVQKFISSGGWMAGKSPSTTPTSISWSPKGKQLALGLQSGDILTFSPSAAATPKSCIPHPPATNGMSVISIHWLSTTSFHTIYAPPGKLTPDAEQIHFHSSLDSKSNSAQDIKFSNPYLPFPGVRPPGEFLVCLRDWGPSKVLLFIGDSTSSDIGLIGSTVINGGESWYNFSLEETSTPSLPLDKDQDDTILLGMDVDLTGSESYHHSTASGEALELPAHPIMYVYASDGTILGWHVLNVTGASYPGMVSAVNASIPAPSGPSGLERELSDMQTTPIISPTSSSLMETSTTKLPSTVFGQPSLFGTQGSSGPVFGQPAAFGQTALGAGQQPPPVFSKPPVTGQSATTSVFGSTSAPALFGQSSASTFGSAISGGGFGAFSSAGPAKFGQTGFGFGGPPQTTPPTAPLSTSVPEESMASEDTPSLGGVGLGAANSQKADSRPSIFGNTSVSVSSTPVSTEGGLIKQGTGFGAFGGFDQKSPFAKPSAFTSSFSSGTPGPSTGAFSNLQTTPSSFVKPASGFFGELPKESPFFAATKPVESKPVSAFALSTTPNSMPSKTSSAQPTFGSSSMPGGGPKSAFAPISATPAQPPPASAGAFSAFSGGGGFAAFSSGGTKSFSDLLRSGGQHMPSGPTPSEETPAKPPQPSPQPPVSTTPVSAFPKEPPKPFLSSGGGFAAFASGGNKPFGNLLRDNGEGKSPVPAPSEETPAKPAQPPPQATFTTTPAPGPATEPLKSFAAGGGGFAAFAVGGNKTFGDLLRGIGEDKSPVPPPSEETPAKPAQPPPQTTFSTTPTTELFGTGSSGFAAFASGGNKSFGDLLRSSGEAKSPAPTPSEETPAKLAQPLSQATFSTIPVPGPTTEPPKLFGTSGGGFAAFASGGNKPFADLLRGEEKSPVSVPPEETPAKPAQPPLQPVLTTPAPKLATELSKPFTTGSGSLAVFLAGEKISFADPLRIAGGDMSTVPVPPSKPASVPPQPPVLITPVSRPASEPPKLFPSGSGGFTGFTVGGNKPFGDLLRTTGGDKSPASTPPEPTPFKLAPPAQPPVSVTPISVVPKEPSKLFPGGGFAAFSFGGGKPFGDARPTPPSSTPSRGELSEAAPTKSIQPPLSPPASATSASKEPAKTPTPPVVKTEVEISEIKTSERAVETTEEEEEGGEVEEGGETGEGESILSEIPSESEEEESEALSEAVEEEEVEKPAEEETKPPPAPAPVPPPTPEQGMQRECSMLVVALDKEMEILRRYAIAASLKLTKLQHTSEIAHQKSDLTDRQKWTFGDIEEYGRWLMALQADVRELKLEPASLRKFLKELNSNMLKVNTRKEEIIRFNKAKMDAEFAKMLKIRTLAPEYSETQSQLRRSIRAIRDRVQKLEDHLQASKKRINELRTGRPSLRPPSLDTVNRTFRNIDIAIERQKQEMSQLRQRMATLEISGGPGARDQLAVSSPKRPLNVTPNVAITTAAALNAERSAQRLKKALLATRTQPLLNTTAVVKRPAVEAPKILRALPAPPATPATPLMSFPSSLPAWTPPPPSEFGSPAMHDLSISRSRAGTKHHQRPIMLKRNGSPAAPTTTTTTMTTTTTQPSLFEWKPVEAVRPASSLPFAIRPTGLS